MKNKGSKWTSTTSERKRNNQYQEKEEVDKKRTKTERKLTDKNREGVRQIWTNKEGREQTGNKQIEKDQIDFHLKSFRCLLLVFWIC